jgi:hypothetical protein
MKKERAPESERTNRDVINKERRIYDHLRQTKQN